MTNDEKKLLDEISRLSKEIEKLKTLNLDNILSSKKPASSNNKKSDSRPQRPKKNEKPDWVKEWDRKNQTNGRTQHIVKTDEETGKTEKLLPVVVPPAKQQPPIQWAERPTHDSVAPRGLTNREALEWEKNNPGKPLSDVIQGPTKPVRKQMTRLNKVWKYRNFKACDNCGKYDTWEARFDPYSNGVHLVHAEIWCHTCGSVDYEVSEHRPAHIGSWAPPKESDKEIEMRAKRQKYRRERATFSLVQKPKTAMELCVWFREVEKYTAVDLVMIELMLRRMESEGSVVFAKGLWWDAEDYAFESNT